ARVEFWGDTIESIRRFDVLTQLSVGPLESLRILPVDVRFAPRPASNDASSGAMRTLLSYLPPEAVMIDAAGGSATGDWERTWTEVQRLHAAEVAAGNRPDSPASLFSPPEEVANEVGRFPRIFVGSEGAPRSAPEVHF